jgi:hypothetical protein
MSKIIIGLGTGRCGSKSLSHLLNISGANISHEMKPILRWQGSEIIHHIKSNLSKGFQGDVASYYLSYVDEINDNFDALFICLKRNKEETVKSFLGKTIRRNHWVNHDGKQWFLSNWDKCFPKYNTRKKKEAIEIYWEEYYQKANEYQTKYDNFKIFDTECLNSEEGLKKIYSFLEIDGKIKTGIRLNVSQESKTSKEKIKMNSTLKTGSIRNILMVTDDYLYLLPVFAELYNKYIGEDVTVLCYKTPETELPENFNIISLGNQADRGSWSDGLRKFFDNFHEPYFKLWSEDYFLYGIDQEAYEKAHEIILKDKAVKRILLCIPQDKRYKRILKCRRNLKKYNDYDNFLYLKDGKRKGIDSWRTSLFTSIWETKYFKELLKPNLMPKEFERKNRCRVKNDGQVQLVSKGNCISFQNTVVGGELNGEFINLFYKNDIQDFKINGGHVDPKIENILNKGVNNLSICITCKNRSKIESDKGTLYLLPNCIDSIIDASKNLNVNIEIVISDWQSTDWPLKEWLPQKLEDTGISYKIVDSKRNKFNAGYGRNIAAEKSSHDYIFFLDADMILPQEILEDAINYLNEGKIFFPISREQHSLEVLSSGFGNFAISKKQYISIGNWRQKRKWGKEDTDYYNRCIESRNEVVREFYFDFIHQWHPPKHGWPNQNRKQNKQKKLGREPKQLELKRKIEILREIKRQIND